VILILPFALGGANTAVLTAATAIVYLGWAALALALVPSDARLVARMAPVVLPLILLLGWTALPFRPDLAPRLIAPPAAPDLLGVAWCHAFSLIALLIGCAGAARLPGFTRTTATWLCLCAVALITATLALRAFGTVEQIQRLVVDHRHHRFAGLIGNANAAGIFYGMLSLLLHGVARMRWRDWQTRPRGDLPTGAILAAFGVIVTLVLVALSQSRTALAATLAAHIACGIGYRSQRRSGHALVRWSIPALLLIATGVALWASAGAVLDRYGALGANGSGRIAILQHAIALASQAPLTGYGLGGFDTVNQRQLTPDTVLLVGDFGAAHNAPLQLAIEAGWPGLALVVLALAALLWRIARAPSTPANRSDTIGRTMLLAVAVAATGSLVDIALNVPAIAALSAALLGITWGRTLRESATYPARHHATHPNPWPTAAMRNAKATPAGVSPSNRSIAPR
jgi:O-antigen ligase